MSPQTQHDGRLPARALAAFLVLHGIAHLAGTSTVLGKAANGESAEYLAGTWTVSDPALLRTLGVLWALTGAAFVIVAIAVWRQHPNWRRVLAAVSLASLLVIVVALWSSTAGVIIDIGLLALAGRAGGRRRLEALR